MPRKPMSPEARKAFGEKMRLAREAKKNQNEEKTTTVEAPSLPEEVVTEPMLTPSGDTISQQDYIDLLKQVAELKDMVWKTSQPADTSVSIQNGRVIGSVTKYDLTAASYPNPIERLAVEPRLSRFAFPVNYQLTFEVGISEYTTAENIRTKEPKFTLVLAGRIFDDETGLPKHNDDGSEAGYVVCRLIMHEDPEAALVIAREQGLEVSEVDEEAFLNEMRYIRMRDWLLECFYPAPRQINQHKKDIVIGGKIVESFQITSENSEKIPFEQLTKKL